MTKVSYILAWTEEGEPHNLSFNPLGRGHLSQRVFEAFAQGLRDHGDFDNVHLTAVEYVEKEVGF